MKNIMTLCLIILMALSSRTFAAGAVDVRYEFLPNGQIGVTATVRAIPDVNGEWDYVLPLIQEDFFLILSHDEASVGRSAQYCSITLTNRNRQQYMDIFNTIISHNHAYGLTVSWTITPNNEFNECRDIRFQQWIN